MTLADPLRRPRLASGVYGLALAGASAIVLGRWPALSHGLPSPTDTALGLGLALAASVAGRLAPGATSPKRWRTGSRRWQPRSPSRRVLSKARV